MSEFERIINDSMMNEVDYIPGYDDGEWPQDCDGEEDCG
jgi:hypothetical protein